MNDTVVTGFIARIRAIFGGLSTAAKMFALLSLGLMPLGVLAIAASLENASAARDRDIAESQAMLSAASERLTTMIARTETTIRAASDAVSDLPDGADLCRRTLLRLEGMTPRDGRYALFGDANAFRCASPGYRPPSTLAAPGRRSTIAIEDNETTLDLAFYDDNGAIDGNAELPLAGIARIVGPQALPGNFGISLIDGAHSVALRPFPLREGGVRTYQTPLAGGPLELRIEAEPSVLGFTEIAIILMPLLMWLAAAFIGWIIVDRLLLRPLVRLEKVISAYQPGGPGLDLPTVRSPAREIAALGRAFDQSTRTVARHEAELEAAVDRQTRLVREVHHRVKNNLQVVASLLNLHSRSAATDAVAAAYASIQRRVDALAVVHRNHYAELEQNRGVALRPLIAELGASLRASAPAEAAQMQIRLDVEPVYVTQDVAVSVAFLITEIVEFGMICGAGQVTIGLEVTGEKAARLTIQSDSLSGTIDCDPSLQERFERIITGLARQLRSALDRDADQGRYCVTLNILEAGDG